MAQRREKLEFRVVNSDIVTARVDVAALKYAGSFHGADRAIANAIGFSSHLEIGQYAFVKGTKIGATEALFIGVGPLRSFRYEEIRVFGQSVIELVTKERPSASSLALTIHGPGYGLDEKEAFLSLMGGLEAAPLGADSLLRFVSIFERSDTCARRLEGLLGTIRSSPDAEPAPEEAGSNVFSLRDYGARSESKPRLFVAMPFAEDYMDEYHIAFTEAAHKCGYLCERLDLESFVGDVVSEIKTRILSSEGVIALLNDHNPNVFLAIGFALAHGKPIILVVKKGTRVPFDVRGQRYLEYERIHLLREKLTLEIANLKASGILGQGSRKSLPA